jgi:hypothetical protein
MREVYVNIIEIILGAVLIGLGLLYLGAQSSTLQSLVDKISQDLINDRSIYKQYTRANIDQVSDGDLCAAIMGYREIPLMIDEYMIYVGDYDYKKIFTYIKTGHYKKEYIYDDSRTITMIRYSYIGY